MQKCKLQHTHSKPDQTQRQYAFIKLKVVKSMSTQVLCCTNMAVSLLRPAPSSLGCYLSCTVLPNLLKPLVNLNSLNVQLNCVDSWATIAAAMGNSTPSLGDCNLACWKSLLMLGWKFLYSKALCYTGLSLAMLRRGKQASARDMKKTLQKLYNVYLL